MSDASMKMRVRCVRAIMASGSWSSFHSDDEARAFVDAVFAELMKPTPGMVSAAIGAGQFSEGPTSRRTFKAALIAAIRAAKDGR